jgi:hypothetical protein
VFLAHFEEIFQSFEICEARGILVSLTQWSAGQVLIDLIRKVAFYSGEGRRSFPERSGSRAFSPKQPKIQSIINCLTHT